MKSLLCCLPIFLAGVSLASDKLKNDYTLEQLRPFLEAKTWTVFSLDPDPWVEGTNDPFAAPAPGSNEPATPPVEPKRKVSPDKEFHDYPILGQHILPVTPEMKLIIEDLDRAGQLWSGGVAACYFPRHGIRVVEGKHVYDLQVCYECFTAILIADSVRVGAIYFAGPGINSPQAPNPNALNALLKKAGVKLPPPPRH